MSTRVYLLDPDVPPDPGWGPGIPLFLRKQPPFSEWRDERLGVRAVFGAPRAIGLLLDSGFPGDGMLNAELFETTRHLSQELRTNSANLPAIKQTPYATFASVELGGQTQSNLTFMEGVGNLLGLDFLLRHQATINFSKRRMYLQLNNAALPSNGFPDHFATTLGWWDLEGAAPHFTKESLAECMVSPPNLHPADSLSFCSNLYTAKVLSSSISISRPDASIHVIDLSPGDYHIKIRSRLLTNATGVVPTMSCAPENSDAMIPMNKRGTIFVLHDYNNQKEWMFPWGFLFAQAGYRTILVDVRGHGESTCRTISYGKREVSDLAAVLDFINGPANRDGKVGVFGVGYGADLALNWAARDERVDAIVAIAPYDKLEPAFQRMAKNEDITISDGVLRESLQIVAAKLDIRWSDWSGSEAIRRIKKPVLLISGGRDSVSPPQDIELLQGAARPGSKALVISDATHENVWYWIDEISKPTMQWFTEHIPPTLTASFTNN
jgi:pimeloyl-ACP methyl ester carboxylesterase